MIHSSFGDCMFLVVFATFVTMRFYSIKAFCFVLLFSTLSYQANISKQVNEKANLQDEKVDANVCVFSDNILLLKTIFHFYSQSSVI